MLLAIRGHPDGNVDTSRESLHPTDRQNPERAKGEKSQPCRVGMLARFDVQERRSHPRRSGERFHPLGQAAKDASARPARAFDS